MFEGIEAKIEEFFKSGISEVREAVETLTIRIEAIERHMIAQVTAPAETTAAVEVPQVPAEEVVASVTSGTTEAPPVAEVTLTPAEPEVPQVSA